MNQISNDPSTEREVSTLGKKLFTTSSVCESQREKPLWERFVVHEGNR